MERREKHFWVRAGALIALGIAVVALLGSTLLSISHAPAAHDVPLGYVAPNTDSTALDSRAGDSLDLVAYGSREAAITAIKRMDVYGALIVGDGGAELLKSTAASPQVASVVTTLAGSATAGAAAPRVTEVRALPSGDSGGGSLGVMLQVIILAGMIGAVALGRLVPRYRANWPRGELPVFS